VIKISKIYLDNVKCCGCGACVFVCPEVFKMGTCSATIRNNTINEIVLKAAKDCPMNAITIKE